MREAVKVLAVVVFMFAAPAAALGWFETKPASTTPILRYACPVLCVLALALFLKIHFRADDAPDYLRSKVSSFFNRDGFCFGIQPTAHDGLCFFEFYFQNQYANRCVGRIALRPARGFFLGRADMDSIIVEIACEPGAFGVARLAVPIPSTLQGRRQPFEVGASVDYPGGKGTRVRFKDGIVLRANSEFGNAFASTLMIAATVTGQIVYASPVTIKLDLPKDVAEDVKEGIKPTITTLWKLGDPPLPASAG